MAKTKISEFSSTPGNNTDIDGINIAEGCAPSGINNAIRELMSQLKDFQAGTAGDSFNGPVGTSTAAAGAFTTLTTSSTVTHNAGTANGVAYLNGSKVLTTGSALTFDGSNLGLGVTPSAWSGFKAFQANYGGFASFLSGGNIQTGVFSNVYFDGSGYKYISTNVATSYNQNNGVHQWYTAPSGTAGAAISFTQAMTLDASGRLGIAVTSPQAPLHVRVGSNQNIYLDSSGGVARITAVNDAVNDNIDLIVQGERLIFNTDGSERARIDSSGTFYVGKVAEDGTQAGFLASKTSSDGYAFVTNTSSSGNYVLGLNRQNSDGDLVVLRQANTQEGSISVSGTTVSYNGGHLSRWAQTTKPKDNTLVKGTVLSNLDEMNQYVDADGNPVENEQLNKVKVSDVEGDANVAGVFVNWSHDDAHNVDEINMAMTGDMIIRIAQGVTVQRGDLLMSAGNGTAKPQGDDIVRSKTIAKVTSTHVTCTYADGSFCVPCVLMAC